MSCLVGKLGLGLQSNCFSVLLRPDLEKAARGASGACGHFVGNHAILRTFLSQTWRIEVGQKRFKVGGWRMGDLEIKIEDGGLWIEDRHTRFDLRIRPCHTNI